MQLYRREGYCSRNSGGLSRGNQALEDLCLTNKIRRKRLQAVWIVTMMADSRRVAPLHRTE